MGKVLDAFKHLLIEDEDEEKKDKQELPKVEEKESVKEPEPVKTEPVATEIPVDKEVDSLRIKLIKSATVNAGDFAKFLDMVESLREMLPDERTCFRAAFTAINKTSPMTVQSLIASLGECIKSLDAEVTNFQNTINSRQAEIEKLRKQVQDKNDQIVKLQNEIKELLAKIDGETRKNDQVGLNFDRAIKSAKYDLESLATKIKSYLEGE